MSTRIVVGYVDTPGGHDALAMGAALAALDPAAELVVSSIYLYNPPVSPEAPKGFRKVLHDRAADELATAQAHLPDGVDATLRTHCGVSPADGLHRLAAELGATTIVVGVSHEHGLGRITAGSATEQTLHGAPCAVAVAPNGYAGRPHGSIATIVAAHNGSQESDRALRVAAGLARAAHARLQIVGVVDETAVWYGAYMGPAVGAELRAAVRAGLEDAAATVQGVDDVLVRDLDGGPERALRAAAQDADLLVLGSRGHGPVARTLLGSVSSPLVRRPPCPLVVVPRTAVQGDDAAAADAAGAGEPAVAEDQAPVTTNA
jgi:nucleotide-binding universal stress UspA family protein